MKSNYLVTTFQEVDFLAKKKGDKYKCDECGMVILIEEPCGCESCELICCSQPMKQVKVSEKKPAPKAKKA